MPVVIPKVGKTEIFCMGAAGVSVFAPFLMLLPGAEQRVASQTAYWGRKWERNMSYLERPFESGMRRFGPPIERVAQKTVRGVETRLHLEQNMKRVDRGIKKSMDYCGLPKKS